MPHVTPEKDWLSSPEINPSWSSLLALLQPLNQHPHGQIIELPKRFESSRQQLEAILETPVRVMQLPMREIAMVFLDDEGLIIGAECYVPFPQGHYVQLETWACGEVLEEIESGL